jgi:lipopolysaccharide/colanic/teichoic acid biosynthesis glycosyltransferase
MLKFRSMREGAERIGPGITSAGDRRVTAFGAFLRKTKLDELPQLWNVLTGDMSLVGPRPELSRYVDLYDATQRIVLQVRPGITDPASIRYRHEERLLASSTDPERFYVETVMPNKLTLNLEYLSRMSVSEDVKVLFQTLRCVTLIEEH